MTWCLPKRDLIDIRQSLWLEGIPGAKGGKVFGRWTSSDRCCRCSPAEIQLQLGSGSFWMMQWCPVLQIPSSSYGPLWTFMDLYGPLWLNLWCFSWLLIVVSVVSVVSFCHSSPVLSMGWPINEAYRHAIQILIPEMLRAEAQPPRTAPEVGKHRIYWNLLHSNDF